MVQIVRRVVDRDGNPVSQDTLVRFSSRQEAEAYIEDHIAKFPHRGYNAEHGYWWGRQDDDTQISRFTIES